MQQPDTTISPEKVQELLQKQVRKIAAVANTVAPDFDPESIHLFRVGVKKLRAVIHFINSVTGQPYLELNKSFKHLYGIAGTIRDTHLKYQTLTNAGLRLPEYYSNLDSVTNRGQAAWVELQDKKVMHKLYKRVTDHNIGELTADDLATFFKNNVRKIKKINKNNPDDEQVHKMRKLIKDLVYITLFAEKRWGNAHNKVAHLPHDQLISISNLVGDFNDGFNLLYDLSSFSSPNMQLGEKTAIADYLQTAQKQHLLVREDLLRQIGEFVNMATEGLK